MFIPIVLLLIFCLPNIVLAESTIECHCFQDRLFNHRDTAAADPYFLATAQNSFLSQIYSVDKRMLVKEKMAGISGDELWIRHELARQSGVAANQIEASYKQLKDWQAVLQNLEFSSTELQGRYQQQSSSPQKLASWIVDQQLNELLGTAPTQLQQCRSLGMTNNELILALLLDGDPVALFQQVRRGEQTWGGLLFQQGYLDGAAIKRLIRQKISPSG